MPKAAENKQTKKQNSDQPYCPDFVQVFLCLKRLIFRSSHTIENILQKKS